MGLVKMALTKLLFDADMLLYIACEKAERIVHWYDGIYSLYGDLNEAIIHYDNHVRELTELVLEHYNIEGEYEGVMCLSDNEHNFRNLIYPEYKANRGEKRRPILYKPMREWVMNAYNIVCLPWLEADDCIGLQANTKDTIVISGDKDLRTVPSRFYDFSRNIFYEYDQEESDKFHLMQTLTGDSTDNYKGCPNIGSTRAERFLDKEGYTWENVVNMYKKQGSTESEAITNARLAFILRKGFYDKKNQRVRLWLPNTDKKKLPILDLKAQQEDF